MHRARRTSAARSAVTTLLALLVSCGGGGAETPLEGFPDTLDGFALRDDEVFDYAPAFPLWSNGSDKSRFVWTPSGDAPTPGAFEPGTLFFKRFAYGDYVVETRVIRVTDEGAEYAVYQHEDGDPDVATRLEARLPTATPDDAPGDAALHIIPAEGQCVQCHDAGVGPILGYTTMQLEGDLGDVPEDAEAVIGYVLGNCAHCHNGGDSINSRFDLRPEVFLDHTVGVPTASSASGDGIRVVPGDPESSVLYNAVLRAPLVMPMPPVGVQIADTEAQEMLFDWIDGLDP